MIALKHEFLIMIQSLRKFNDVISRSYLLGTCATTVFIKARPLNPVRENGCKESRVSEEMIHGARCDAAITTVIIIVGFVVCGWIYEHFGRMGGNWGRPTEDEREILNGYLNPAFRST